MKATVIVFPGSNCDRDIQVALETYTGSSVGMVWHGDTELQKTDLIVLPGGFSYGDYLRCGAMSARAPIMREVITRAAQGVAVLGICNGFQILIEAGLLPGALLLNSVRRFVCRDVYIRVENARTPFTNQYKSGQVLRIPVAHRDGQYFADKKTLEELKTKEQIAFRYCDIDGNQDRDLVNERNANPNGSIDNIAGIFNERKTVLGLMPHPERAADVLHGSNDGAGLLNSLVATLS